MDVSFIVPAMNEENYIEHTLKSIKAQKTRLKYEIIVCDGYSKDKTAKIARKYARVVLKHGSIAVGRNAGAAAAKGKLLVFIDADSTLPRNYLDRVWKAMNEDPKIVAVTVRVTHTRSNDSLNSRIVSAYTSVFGNLFAKLSFALGFPRLLGINTAIWKAAFRKAGGFPDVPSEDIALSWTLRRMGKIKYIDNLQVMSSARRFESKPLGVMSYYIFRDIETSIKMNTHTRFGWLGKRFRNFVKRHAKYEEIR